MLELHEQAFAVYDIPRSEYEALKDSFDPVKYNPEEWVLDAKAAGMSYICFTANLAYDTLITDGGVLEAKTLGVAMGKLMAEFNKYFTLSAEETLVQQVNLNALGSIDWNSAPNLIVVGNSNSFATNPELTCIFEHILYLIFL